MTGYPEYNYPAFFEAEKRLTAAGYVVINPARNPNPDPVSWEGFMKMAVKQVCDADIVGTLPKWWESDGAMVEVWLARALKILIVPVCDLVDGRKT